MQHKFRAWDIYYNKFIYSDEGKMSEFWRKVEGGKDARGDSDDRVPVMQFTGLKDKNGKEIYEGDILKEVSELSDHEYQNRVGKIVYEPQIASFLVFTKTGWCHLNYGELGRGMQLQFTEVIGDIHQNLELLSPSK